MKKKLRGTRTRVTYANVVATLALFIALGGVSWAATSLPKNSVTSKAIKKNAVTSAKIKKNAVTGAKVKSRSLTGSDVKGNSLTGAQINEGTLGTVPSATTAASAGSVDTLISVYKKTAASDQSSQPSEDAARVAAPQVPLVTYGQLTVYGKCYIWNGSIEFNTYAAASANYASMYGYSISDSPYQFGPGTPETDTAIDEDDQSNPGVDENYGEGARIIGADGKGMNISTQTWAQIGSPTDGPSHIGPNECSWQVTGIKTG